MEKKAEAERGSAKAPISLRAEEEEERRTKRSLPGRPRSITHFLLCVMCMRQRHPKLDPPPRRRDDDDELRMH